MTLPVITATLTDRPARLRVQTPYLPEFPARAKALGGKWLHASRLWEFDPRDSDRVAALCTELFGYDWETIHTARVESISLTIPAELFRERRMLYGFGRELIRRGAYGVTLGEGVLLLDGSFLGETSTCTLEIRDIPEAIVDRKRRWWEDHGATIESVSHGPQRTLPREPTVNVQPIDVDPDVAAVLATWRRLSAKQQARVLLLLRDTLPATRWTGA